MSVTFSRSVLGFIVCMAVGWGQLLGVSRGFLCECDEVVRVASTAWCETSLCHPEDGPRSCGGGGVGDLAEAGGAEGVGHGCPDGESGHGSDHRHREVRDSLVGASAAGGISVPAPVFYDLPPSLQAAAVRCRLRASRRPTEAGSWPSGPPPAPVLVARTVVMRV